MRLALLLTLAVLAAPTVAAGYTPPVLHVVDAQPLTVRAAHFRPLEKVIVTARVEGIHVRSVRASATGRFVVRFAGLDIAQCTAYRIVATGDRGSRAVIRYFPECGAEPTV